jgi:DNA-binding NarL/FixJ family response regulator
MKKTVAICEMQPIAAEGLRALLLSSTDLEVTCVLTTLSAIPELLRTDSPSVIVLDKAFGGEAVMSALAHIKDRGAGAAPVVWGLSITESEALRYMQAGARGIVRKTADLDSLLVCLRSVASGATWMQQSFLNDRGAMRRTSRIVLTPRERQVMELVGHGLKNREVAFELGIRPGTVKVHLKHIFEKTGASGRYSLALSGLAEEGVRTAAD